jgi:hypothetical protein
VQEWIDPKNPTAIIRATNEEGMARGLRAVPKSQDEWNAVAQSAAQNASSPEEAQKIRDRYTAFGVGAPPKTPAENAQNEYLINTRLQNALPVPSSEYPGSLARTNKNPAGPSPNLSATLSALSDQYFKYDPDTRGNRIIATDKAIQQLVDEKYLDPNPSRRAAIIGSTSIELPVRDKEGNIVKTAPHYRVDLLDPKTGKPYAEGKAPAITMRRSVSSAVVPPSTQQPQVPPPTPLPPGAIAVAPAGTADGHIGTSQDGRTRVVVRNGFVYPMP